MNREYTSPNTLQNYVSRMTLDKNKLEKVLSLLDKCDVIAVAYELEIPIKTYYMTYIKLPCGHKLPIISGIYYLLINLPSKCIECGCDVIFAECQII